MTIAPHTYIYIYTFLLDIANIEAITLYDNVYQKDLFVYMQIMSGSSERRKIIISLKIRFTQRKTKNVEA